MNEERLTKKEKVGYWVKIIFFAIFGLICAVAGLYTIITYPFSLAVLIFFLGMGVCGTTFCSWVVVKLIKEYFWWIKKEKDIKE